MKHLRSLYNWLSQRFTAWVIAVAILTFFASASSAFDVQTESQKYQNGVGRQVSFTHAGLNTFLKFMPWGVGATTISANYTFVTEFPCETAFTNARVVFFNYGASAMTWPYVAAAASPTSGNSGTTLTPVPVYFNAPTFPQWSLNLSSGTTRSVTVPAATGTGASAIPGFAYSDWFTVASVTRTDVTGGLPILQVRANISSAGSGVNWDSTSEGNYNTLMPGRNVLSNLAADTGGAFVTSWTSNSLIPTTSANWYAPFYIEYRSQVRGVTVLGIGDSLTAGQIADSGSGNRQASWLNTACASVSNTVTINGATVPVCPLNFGFPGAYTASFRETANLLISGSCPDVIVLSPSSPNDGINNVEDAYNDILQVVDLARSKGIAVVVTTLAPFGNGGAWYSAAANVYRQQLNTLIRNQGANGGGGHFWILDIDQVIADPTDTQIAPAYFGTSYIHWNTAGYAAVSAAFAPILTNIIKTGH